jgi:D-alanine-D-alanine ligase
MKQSSLKAKLSPVDSTAFGRVAVVMGGNSRERQVSLWSGEAVLAGLRERGVHAFAVDGIPALLQAIQQRQVDRVFIILHGPGGEDGTLQGALEAMNVPYTGSGVLASALGMDKIRSKRIWLQQGLPTAEFRLVGPKDTAQSLLADFGLPMVVKPSCEGSTFGITLARNLAELEQGLAAARAIGGEIFVERLIEGFECTCAVLELADGLHALPVIRIVPKDQFYDFDAKYLSDHTQYLIPSGFSDAVEQRMQTLAKQAFQAIGASGWARIDFMVSAQDEVVLLEANTAPGMTSHSLVPKAAAAVEIDFASLCLQILHSSFIPRGNVRA